MIFSLNLYFTGELPPDAEWDHPSGAVLARSLTAVLRSTEWEVSDFENWRDSGWALVCRRGEARVEIAFAELEPSVWLLQVAPVGTPGLLGRLLGRTTSAERHDIYDLSRTVHDILRQDSRLAGFRWRWNGFPQSGSSNPEPVRWNEDE